MWIEGHHVLILDKIRWKSENVLNSGTGVYNQAIGIETTAM